MQLRSTVIYNVWVALKLFFGTEEIRMTVKFENLKPENESKEKNARWRLLYVDDMMNTGEFSITHEFSYLTGNDYYIDVYNSKKDRTTSTYRISIRHFRAEFLKWIDNVIVMFNATLNALAFDNICHPKVMKWIEERKPSLDKLAVDCSFPSVTIRNILNYCHPKNEFYTRCEVFEPSGWTPSSETTKSTHVTNSLDFNDLLKLGVPIINSQCTEFTDNVLNDFLKNWTTSMRKLEYLSVVRTPNNPEINEDTVIEGLDVTRMEQTVRFERGGRTFSFTGYSILNGRGQKAVFGIDRGFLPMLKNINYSLIRLNYAIDPAILEEYLFLSPNQETIQFDINLKSELEQNSKIYETEHLRVASLGQPTDHFLLNFSGRSLFLENTNVQKETIIECLRAWNSDMRYQNLNFLSIELYDVFTDVRQIMNQFNVKEIEKERNPPVFMIPRRSFFLSGTYSVELASRRYVVNESNGHVATFSMSNKIFAFAVWRMTEKEFLDKVSS
ncbi:hypothetical protein GCK72_002657 [Caenorhabditis remanei]|uniref:Sdz-33 F-box domain-containing protein n=1 Tax=Caenorhabditis remanei TaxID=31234 RepID=A0A6A5HWR5_CAERE|nr:hypothetical protein GCK72_002657 [Caenorhabditis remanei]KAF1770833.1 hypothetical protein GCK72_002657 [Caenorhabditis remanei]